MAILQGFLRFRVLKISSFALFSGYIYTILQCPLGKVVDYRDLRSLLCKGPRDDVKTEG
jgi:hypothetical protein